MTILETLEAWRLLVAEYASQHGCSLVEAERALEARS